MSRPQPIGPFSQPAPTAVLISGGGRTLRNLLARQAEGQLPIDIRLVIASTKNAGGLAFAEQFGVPHRVVVRKDRTDEQYREAIFQPCRDVGAECVVMAGWLKHVLIPDDFENRVINIHPSLIPAFCGEGFYGSRVHQAVIDSGTKISGCTVHLVDNQYDHGPIVVQRAVEVADTDDANSLAARIFEQECEALPAAIAKLCGNQLVLDGRRVRATAM